MTEAITAACNKMARAAAIADRASVRGVRLHRNSEMRLPRSNQVARRPRHLGIDCGEQPLDRARRWRTECLIQVNRLDKLLADQVILPRQFAVVGQRSLHTIGVAATQRTGRVPWQQSFYLLRLRLFVYPVHGQPLSIPSDLSSSASRLRA